MRAGAALRRAAVRRVLAAELDLVYHDPGSPNSGILVGSSGNASATALDPIAAWHWPGLLASDGYGRDALGGAMSGHGC